MRKIQVAAACTVAAIALASCSSTGRRTFLAACENDRRALESAIQEYYLENGSYPSGAGDTSVWTVLSSDGELRDQLTAHHVAGNQFITAEYTLTYQDPGDHSVKSNLDNC